ncbi:MAG: hypothetical protein A2W33_06175 [Chloroflexi bacterium RBG_16_52_11]|nr:MAG: hypothetical protein A2W33_06175 [Chloroflexi bacterium RBG_16_52_11]
MENRKNILEAIYERDIDLLVLEEMHVSPAFRKWLVDIVLEQKVELAQFLNARHSISQELGESDLFFEFEDAFKHKWVFLIENKITAPSQPDQAKRYADRGKLGEWDEYKTIILAPEAYLHQSADAPKYDKQITYEMLRGWFLESLHDRERAEYKARIIQDAIDQNRRRNLPLPDPRVTRFWYEYWLCASREFPELAMPMPGDKGAGSNWIGFKPNGLGKGRNIYHKMDSERVDLEIAGAAGSVEKLRSTYSSILADTEIVEAGKSAALRIRVPKLYHFGNFQEQIDNARAGMRAAYRLFYQSLAIKNV